MQKGFTLILIAIVFAVGGYFLYQQQTKSTPVTSSAQMTAQPSPASNETTNWKTYTNTKYAYSIKFPDSYEVRLQSEKEKSQLGVDANVCVKRKSDTSCLIVIDVYNNPSNLSLENYVKSNFKSLITGPLIPYQGNGYSSLLVKNQPGWDEFRIHNSNIYHINASIASSNKEIGDIVATFKFIDTSVTTTNWKTYTNTLGNVNIQFPPSWTVKESHELSNRVVDNPKEINTAVLSGSEGQIVIQWGPMGFGGGCDPKDHKSFTIKNKTWDICNVISDDGTEYWAGIGNGASDDRIVEVRATAYKPISSDSQTIKAILSTITFN